MAFPELVYKFSIILTIIIGFAVFGLYILDKRFGITYCSFCDKELKKVRKIKRKKTRKS